MRVKINKFFSIFLIIFVLSFSSFAKDLKIHFLDVGQADSILIELPIDQTMLIDGGNNEDSDFIVNYLRSQGVKKIDYLVGTHPHEDHIGGLDVIIKSFDIGNFYMPRVIHTTKTFEDVLLAAQGKDLKIKAAKAGNPPIIYKNNLKLFFLGPINNNYENLNYYSLVIKLVYKETSFLFTGDCEEINENEMLLKYPNLLVSDLLKVGHHGSDSSTSEAFLNTVHPSYAVISVGKDNRYNHPSPIIINRLIQNNVKIYRTDKQGTIIATSDGYNLSFNTNPILNKENKNFNSGIIISSVNLKTELVIIENLSDSTIDISNWKLLSVKGNQEFYFPPGTIISPGSNLKICSGENASTAGQLKWTDKYIWNNKGDPAELYDNKGNLISSYGY